MKKRMFSLFLALVMCLSLLPVGAMAQEPAVSHPTGFKPVPAPEITIAETIADDDSLSGESFFGREAVVQEIRRNMVNRNMLFTVYYESAAPLTADDAYALLEEAMAHTGVGEEGDSLRFCVSHTGVSVQSAEENGVWRNAVECNIGYYTGSTEEMILTSRVDALMGKFGFTPDDDAYYRIKTIYDYVRTNVSYDYDALQDPNNVTCYTAYGAMELRRAVCQGYAILMYRLLLEAGVDARIVTGTSFGENHAWNIVRIGNVYYNLDATWESTNDSETQFFLKSEANFEAEHQRDELWSSETYRAAYPMATGDYTPPPARDVTVDGMVFELGGGKATLKKYTGSAADLTIPASVEGYPVAYIGGSAFHGNTALRSVTIPASVWKILDGKSGWILEGVGPQDFEGAFYGCSGLETVTFAPGSQLTEIGTFAFSDCVALKNLQLPAGIKKLKLECFTLCTSLTSLTLPEGLEEIGQNAFDRVGLTTLHLPASLTSYHEWNDIPNLVSFSVAEGNPEYFAEEGVLYHGSRENATLICYPQGKTDERFVVPDFIESYNGSLQHDFIGHKYLKTVVFPTQKIEAPGKITCMVEVGPDNPYHKVENGMLLSKDGKTLQSVPKSLLQSDTFTVPEGVVEIERYACEAGSFTNLVLPESLEIIGNAAFWDNNNLKTVSFGSNLRVLGGWCFNDCPSLQEVRLPASLELVEDYVFSFCYNLRDVWFLGNPPVMEGQPFMATYGTTIHYPAGNAAWRTFVAENQGLIEGVGSWQPEGSDVIPTPPPELPPVVEGSDTSVPMYRLYNPNSGEHFYTGSYEERNNLILAGWLYEGVSWNAPRNSGSPVYRLFNPNNGDHHYTLSAEERDMLVGVGWKYENVAWNSPDAEGNIPLYRLFNPNADCGSHHYTSSVDERDGLVALGWIFEGVGWFGLLN